MNIIHALRQKLLSVSFSPAVSLTFLLGLSIVSYVQAADTQPLNEDTITIQENDVGFCGVDGTIDNNNSGYTGSGFANTENAKGKSVQYKVKASSTSHFILEFRYATTSSRSANVIINGETVGSINFPATGAWTSWTIDSANLELKQGDNRIHVVAVSDNGLPNIDSLTIVGNNPQAGDCNDSDNDTVIDSVCPIDEPCKILPFGDSITDGYGTPGGYRIALFEQALHAGKNITFVGSETNGPSKVAGQNFPRHHEGHSGWTIDSVSNRTGISTLLPSPALDDDPNIILLHIGTNDVLKAPDDMDVRLENLIDSILKEAPDALLVVAALIPSNKSSYPNSIIIDYNSKIPAIVEERADNGHQIIFVDQYTGFSKTTELADKLHPNEAGYARMAGKWFNAIEKYLH